MNDVRLGNHSVGNGLDFQPGITLNQFSQFTFVFRRQVLGDDINHI